MPHLKTITALRRARARLSRAMAIPSTPRSILLSPAASNRHCSIFLAQARRAGYFHPNGGSRVRGEP